MNKTLSTKGLKTRAEIMQIAYNLFIEQGAQATTIDDILRASGKGKSQFYHYFNNKEDLIHALMQEHLEELKSESYPYMMEIDSWEDLALWLEKQIEFHRTLGKARGCLIGMIGQETTPEQELIRQDVRLIFDAKKDGPKKFFISLKARDQLIDDASPEIMADMVLSTLQGSILLAKVYQNEQLIERLVESLLHSLKSFAK